MTNLRHRAYDPELMDEPQVDPGELLGALQGLRSINRMLGGYSASMAGIRALLPPGSIQPPSGQAKQTLLDVGCGSGDTLEHLHRLAAARGLPLRTRGVELSPVTVAMARQHLAEFADATTVDLANLFDLDPGQDGADLVHAALMLHHTESDGEAVRMLAGMGRLARVGVVINDLHRHGLAYWAIRVLTAVFSRNRILRHDAALSVRRGFLRSELLALAVEAGWHPSEVRIRWHWAFRWVMILPGRNREPVPGPGSANP